MGVHGQTKEKNDNHSPTIRHTTCEILVYTVHITQCYCWILFFHWKEERKKKNSCAPYQDFPRKKINKVLLLFVPYFCVCVCVFIFLAIKRAEEKKNVPARKFIHTHSERIEFQTKPKERTKEKTNKQTNKWRKKSKKSFRNERKKRNRT